MSRNSWPWKPGRYRRRRRRSDLGDDESIRRRERGTNVDTFRKRWTFLAWAVRLEVGHAPRLGAKFEVDDDDVTIGLSVPFLNLYLSIDGPGCRRDPARRVDVWVVDWHVHWSVWTDPMSWSSNTPRWRDGGADLSELVLGKAEVHVEDVEAHTVWVPLIERSYLATATVKRHVRRWSRWPWPKVSRFVDVEMFKGHAIPIPGKGENSYDCGSDALYSMSTPARSIDAAIGRVVGDIMETRRKRGWTDWDPPPPADTVRPEPIFVPPNFDCDSIGTMD